MTVSDFSIGERDRLVLDSALLGGQTTAQGIESAFGSLNRGNLHLDFGQGDVLVLRGMTGLDGVGLLLV